MSRIRPSLASDDESETTGQGQRQADVGMTMTIFAC